ncbi:MAG: metal-sensing transcriptional repressor [Gammaproteobacteria bacterium]|nr:metal-sensing transcriptional repressor [Gammaproteobacteria bacterium]
MKQEYKDAMLKRLARIEGQIRGIQKLIVSSEDCEKTAQQMSAARKALDKASHEMLACMIEREIETKQLTDLNHDDMEKIKTLISKYS